MHLLWLLIVVALAGCSTAPTDPFAAAPDSSTSSARKEKVRRASWEPASREVELIWTPHKELPDGMVKAVVQIGTEDRRLYPDADEKALLELEPVPDSTPAVGQALKRLLAAKHPNVDMAGLRIATPFPPPQVMRLSGRSFPVVIEGKREVVETAVYRLACENRLRRIYNLTLDSAGRPMDDPVLDKIRDIANSAAN